MKDYLSTTEDSTLRLLCSISGIVSIDVTNVSVPLSILQEGTLRINTKYKYVMMKGVSLFAFQVEPIPPSGRISVVQLLSTLLITV